MTTLQTHGGGAQPASIDTSGKAFGGAALRVYGFDSEADARAAGFVCEGGPAMSVALITDAQINSGTWRLEGDPSALAIYTAPAGMPIEGGYSVPVYPVNGWGSAPAPVPPLFSSAEVGAVNDVTVAVTFDQDVVATGSDYSSGVTIKVNGSVRAFESGIRQANHAIVYYALSLAVVNGDTVTWEYAKASGSIVAEDDSTPLEDVSAQSVTNNVAIDYGAVLRAAAVAYWRFEEADNTARVDSKNSISLTSHNPTIQVTGKIGKAFRADSASNGYVDISTAPAGLSAGGKLLYFTVWVKVTNSANYSIITKTKLSSYQTEYAINQVGTLEIYNDSDYAEIPAIPADGNFHFVESVLDARTSTPVFYIALDHADFVSVTGTAPVVSSNEVFEVGASGGFTGNKDIDIDELGIFELSDLPTVAQRNYLWNSGAGRALFPAP